MENGREIEAPLLARLADLGIEIAMHRHPPLHTVEESRALRGAMPGSHIKNLFLRDKKRNQWLVTVPEDASVDLKALRHVLGARGNLSFGSAERLQKYLGVSPGSVTPFGVINDADGDVTMVLDRGLMDYETLNFHPLVNTQTTSISPAGLIQFFESTKHTPMFIDL